MRSAAIGLTLIVVGFAALMGYVVSNDIQSVAELTERLTALKSRMNLSVFVAIVAISLPGAVLWLMSKR